MRDIGEGAPAISVCIVTGRRLALLDAVLAEPRRPGRGAPPFELLVCSDGDAEVARRSCTARFPAAQVCEVDRALPGAARNLLVERARGDLLLFLDDDITLRARPAGPLRPAGRASTPRLDVFGGPNDTPPGSSRFQFVQGAALASIVGSGPVRRRYGAHPPGRGRRALLHPVQPGRAAGGDGALRRRPRVRRGERRPGRDEPRRRAPMYYAPDLAVYHERRPHAPGVRPADAQVRPGPGPAAGPARSRDPAARLPGAVGCCWSTCSRLPLLAAGRRPRGLPSRSSSTPPAVVAAAAWIARTLRRPADVPLAAALLVVLHVCYGSGVAPRAPWRAATHGGCAARPVAWTGAARDTGTVADLRVTPAGVVVDGLWEAYRKRSRCGWRRRGDVTWALRDVDLDRAPGAMLGVVGGNGSGKTTLLQVLAGVLRPTRGSVSDRRVGWRPSSTSPPGSTATSPATRTSLIGGVLLGLSRAELRRRYDEIVAFSGLAPEALDWPLAAYSAGMGLRLGFSLVVHSDPDVLLVDEVLAVGDEAVPAPVRGRGRAPAGRRAAPSCSCPTTSASCADHCDEVRGPRRRGGSARLGRPTPTRPSPATWPPPERSAEPAPRRRGAL